jgi:hypothetical protein
MLGVRGKPFLVSIERWKGSARYETAVSVMLWFIGDHPELREAHQFRTREELRAWLAGVAAVCGSKNVAVDWTAGLRSDRALARLVADCLATEIPQSA